MSTAKRQHYIPRCLLKHICADGQAINVTDLKTNRTYQTNISKIDALFECRRNGRRSQVEVVKGFDARATYDYRR